MPEQTKPQPDMVFTNVTLKRYTDALVDLDVRAQALEMYDEEKIWAGRGISFTQYDTNAQKESIKGKTGILYIEEKSEEYSLGNDVAFHLLEDDIAIKGEALVWKKKEHLLSAPTNEKVSITQKDEMTVEGRSFAANTVTKAFTFSESAHGTIRIKEEQSTSQ